MPLDCDALDEAVDLDINVRPGTNKAAVLKLLYADTDLAYTPAEVRALLDIAPGSVTTTLRRLVDAGAIGTRGGYYYGLAEREDLQRVARHLISTKTVAAESPAADTPPEEVAAPGPVPTDETGVDPDAPGQHVGFLSLGTPEDDGESGIGDATSGAVPEEWVDPETDAEPD